MRRLFSDRGREKFESDGLKGFFFCLVGGTEYLKDALSVVPEGRMSERKIVNMKIAKSDKIICVFVPELSRSSSNAALLKVKEQKVPFVRYLTGRRIKVAN